MKPTVHLLNPLSDANGGSEWRVVTAYERLRAHGPVRLWSEGTPDPSLAARVPIQRPTPLAHPSDGVLVVVGVWFPIGGGSRAAASIASSSVVNTPQPALAQVRIMELIAACSRPVEVVYPSRTFAATMPFPGTVQLSPVVIERFAAPPRDDASRFAVGRLSRDVPFKHHPEDPRLWSELARAGCDVRVLGGTCLAGLCDPAVALWAAGEVDAARFLAGLDCFVYRTAPGWNEPSGRVIVEAMAASNVVVCHRAVGNAELIDHGRNGFLFDTTEEALAIVRDCRQDRRAARAVGALARETVERLYGDAYWDDLAAFHFSSLPPAESAARTP